MIAVKILFVRFLGAKNKFGGTCHQTPWLRAWNCVVSDSCLHCEHYTSYNSLFYSDMVAIIVGILWHVIETCQYEQTLSSAYFPLSNHQTVANYLLKLKTENCVASDSVSTVNIIFYISLF